MPNGQVTVKHLNREAIVMNVDQANDTLDLGEVTRVTYKCVSCSASMQAMVLGKIEKTSIPTFCDTCRMGISRGGRNTPVSLIGRFNSGKSFMDEFVDK